MAITYDKKALKKSKKYLKMGKKRYAIRTALILSLFNAIFIPLFSYISEGKFHLNKFIIYFPAFFIVYFLMIYFTSFSQWENIKKTYEDSIEYFKKNNPEFIADILEQNPDNDK